MQTALPYFEILLPVSPTPDLLFTANPQDFFSKFRNVEPALNAFMKECYGPLRALIYLWHDNWDTAHNWVQNGEGEADWDLVHAIGHRREGDYSNSRFWFEAIGEHPAFSAIADALTLEVRDNLELESGVLTSGKWLPKAFINQIQRRPTDKNLIRVQALELRALAAFWWHKPNPKSK
jgi:hypothetical protein